jgi:hypothetical protein
VDLKAERKTEGDSTGEAWAEPISYDDRRGSYGKSNNVGGLVSIDDCLLARAWDHYKKFIGIIDNGDEENEIDEYNNEAFEGDIDELLKLIGLFRWSQDCTLLSTC